MKVTRKSVFIIEMDEHEVEQVRNELISAEYSQEEKGSSLYPEAASFLSKLKTLTDYKPTDLGASK
jgi:hypothetical protein